MKRAEERARAAGRTRSTSSARGICACCKPLHPPAGRRVALESVRNCLPISRNALSISRPDPDARRPRPEGALPRLGARLLLVVLQSAAAAADLHVRVHHGAAGDAPDGASSRTRCSCSAASCRGRGSPRRCSSRPTSLIAGGNLIKKVLFPAEVLPIVTVLANMVHFFLGLPILVGVPDLLPAAARSVGAAVVSGDRARAARLHDRPGAVPVGADRALPRHQGPARQPADAVVLRDADHLLDAAGADGYPLACSNLNPMTHLVDLVSGGAVLPRARTATGSGCWRSAAASVAACSSPATCRSIGCAISFAEEV